jgi:hypothetical protein
MVFTMSDGDRVCFVFVLLTEPASSFLSSASLHPTTLPCSRLLLDFHTRLLCLRNGRRSYRSPPVANSLSPTGIPPINLVLTPLRG